MSKAAHPSPCCGRRGITERVDAGTFHQRCAKCGKPFSYTCWGLRKLFQTGCRWNERVERFYRIRALPEEYQDRILDAVDRLTEQYAKYTGVELPESPELLSTPLPPANVIQLPAARERSPHTPG